MNRSVENFARKIFILSSFLIIASCGGKYSGYSTQNDPIDRASNLGTQDYVNQLFPPPAKEGVTVETKTPPVPKAADLILTPQKPRIGINKTVSISVTEDVPLKDVFIELARLADVDIEIDPKIQGGVIFKAKNRPFDEVIERITDLAGLRYSVNNGVIRIEADNEYVENYPASFLNLIRQSQSQIGVSNKLSSGTGAASGSGTSGSSGGTSGSSSSSSSEDNGSKSLIDAKSGGDGDIWNSIEREISAIIGAPSTSANSGGAGGSSGQVAVPTAESANTGRFVSLNREAGVISVRTGARNHAKIKEYLAKVKDYYSSQVLIEAKVVEISLKDEFRSGVNWSLISDHAGFTMPPLATTGFPAADVAANIATLNFNSGDLSALVQLAQVFGTTKTLASPRILAMNNQQAVLTFTKNENYFSLQCSATAPVLNDAGVVTSPPVLSVTSQLNTIPIGVVLSMQPSIDTINNDVSLNVRPTLSRLTGKIVADPAVRICAIQAAAAGTLTLDQIADIRSEVPQVDVREMDSVLRLKTGQVMAIGGMIDQKDNNFDSGLPLLSDIPILGNAFKTVDKDTENIQTVIFLRATIVPAYGVDEDDQRLYNKFMNDPRPLKF